MPSLGSLISSGSEDNLIHIPVYYREKKNKAGQTFIQIVDDKKAKEALDKEDKTLKIINTKWKPQTWQMYNLLINSSQSYNNLTGQNEFDGQKYQDNIFKNCLAEWDITDETGTPLPPSPQVLDQLPMHVARALIQKYDAFISMDEEDSKK